ncbi:M15 family metallopeptidase [Crassaminicella thermophila]|uniref:M15 family metallopeptidase n=1 Tax=Crassaminicella thermophila TaxID=2599308 RepID=A0A5C0SD14_CRATE|nr:M15 family metallopeptidase [Crassaminicella thermophila]QEK12425.1 M15 family metallopeptidase [Crassaminicella thermophila]
MKKMIIMLMCIVLFTGCIQKESLQNITSMDERNRIYNIIMKQDLLSLMMAYPEYIKDVEREKDNKIYIVTKSGKRILYDDKRRKNLNEKLSNPDLQDMMQQIYPIYSIKNLMRKTLNPGRIRVYGLLKEVYGNSKEQIKSNLVGVKVGYKYYPFNRKNNAADSLQKVMKELMILMKKRKDIYSFVFPTSGTFNYRYIAGTNRLSPHAFGIAIDLKRDKKDYWKWASREDGQKRLASYPKEIVKIFEKNNFIWGGKWGHFDILHFEYRPELIIKSRYFSDKTNYKKPWYDGVPYEDPTIKSYIQIIEKGLSK